MSPQEQIRFVHDLSETIADEIKWQIRDGNIPENWDGIELRALLAYRHAQSANMGMRDNLRRKRAFNNIVLVNNL